MPAHLHFTSAAGRMGDMLLRQLSGLQNWHVTRSEQAYIDLFSGRTDELVYLTAGGPLICEEGRAEAGSSSC